MSVTIDFPDQIEEQLLAAWGDKLPRATLEGLAVESFRSKKITLGQFARWLGLSIDQANGFLKARSIYLDYSIDDLGDELSAMKELPKQ